MGDKIKFKDGTPMGENNAGGNNGVGENNAGGVNNNPNNPTNPQAPQGNQPQSNSAEQLPVKLKSRPAAYAIDGHSLNFRGPNNIELSFMQIQGKHNDHLDAIGVAGLRMNFQQLKALANDLNKAISDFENKLNQAKES